MQKYANIRLVVNSEAYFIDKCMAVMAMIMRGNNESMLRKQFDWLKFQNVYQMSKMPESRIFKVISVFLPSFQ